MANSKRATLHAFLQTPEVKEVLSLTVFQTVPIARTFQEQGENIPRKMEFEQAWTMAWLLHFVIEHGREWRKAATVELDAARARLKEKGGKS